MRNPFNLVAALSIFAAGITMIIGNNATTLQIGTGWVLVACGIALVGRYFGAQEKIDVVKYLDSFLDRKIKEAKNFIVLSDDRTFKDSRKNAQKLIKNIKYHERLQNEIYALEIRTQKFLLIAFKTSFLDEFKNRDFFKRDHLGMYNFQPGLDNFLEYLKKLKQISIYSLTDTYKEHPTSIDKYDEQKWYKIISRELIIIWLFLKFKTLDLISGKMK